LSTIFSGSTGVEVVSSGGQLVRQVDGDGIALDDGVTVYSVAEPVVLLSTLGITEDLSKGFGTWKKVTLSTDGVPVVRVDGSGNVVTTLLSDGPANRMAIFPQVLSSLTTASASKLLIKASVTQTLDSLSLS
jgi:hypothetical protein